MARIGRYTLLLLAAGALAAFGSESYKPSASEGAWSRAYAYLVPTDPGAAPSAALFLACNEEEAQHRIALYARGLAPAAIYTLTLTPASSGGESWTGLRADEDGVLRLRERLGRCLVDHPTARLTEGGVDGPVVLECKVRVKHEDE